MKYIKTIEHNGREHTIKKNLQLKRNIFNFLYNNYKVYKNIRKKNH